MTVTTAGLTMYEAFGFRVISDFPMPELPVRRDRAYADIRIRKTDLTHYWQEAAVPPGRLIYAQDNSVLFRVPDTAIFRVSYGDEIHVSPLVGMDEDKVRLYLLGTCMAILLLQRKILPLHGSAINIGGRAYAIVGDSGAGKSTLASFLVRQGHALVSDDLIAVSFDEWTGQRQPEVVPSFPQQKLWRDSLRLLDLNPSEFRPLFEREEKFAVPVGGQFHSERLPFGGVYELTKAHGTRVEAKYCNGLEAIRLLYRHTFRNFLVGMLDLQTWHFDLSVRIAKSVPVRRLHRPSVGDTAEQLAEVILSETNGRNQDAELQFTSFP